MLLCLGWGVPTVLEVLDSSLHRVPCLCLFDRVAGLGLTAGGCESGGPLVCLGDGCPRNLLFLSSHEAPAAVDLLDSACKRAICHFQTFSSVQLALMVHTTKNIFPKIPVSSNQIFDLQNYLCSTLPQNVSCGL